ncbi:putative isl2eu-2 adi [Trichonephila clavipes]|nr:putative isl2eu-2 adi [Trichonephila clavipes]
MQSAVPLGLGLNPGEDTDVCKCIVPSRLGGTLNSRRVANPLVRLVERKGKRVGCSMRSGTNLLSAVKMYRFPTNPSRRLQWEAALQRKNWKANPKSALCNKHFITGKPSDAEHPDYVPSIFDSMKNKGSSISVNRYNRQVKRREVWNAPLTEIENEPLILKLDTKEVDCQTDLTFQEISEMEKCTRDKLCEHNS